MSYKWWVNAAKVILFFEITKSFLPNIEEFILRLLWALWQVLIRLQVLFELRDHFATTVAHLWASCVLSVAIVCQMFMPLYIVMPYLRHFVVFVPKICKCCYKKVHKASGRCWLPTPPAWVFFLKKSFRVPTIVPKKLPICCILFAYLCLWECI